MIFDMQKVRDVCNVDIFKNAPEGSFAGMFRAAIEEIERLQGIIRFKEKQYAALTEENKGYISDGESLRAELVHCRAAIHRVIVTIKEPNPAIKDTIWIDKTTTLIDLLEGLLPKEKAKK